MDDFAYPAKISKRRNGAYEVSFVDLADAFTEGATLEEALDNASEVLSGVILARLSHGIDVPTPSRSIKGKNIAHVLPDAKTQSALLIRDAFSGQNVASIARNMDTSWPAVNRLKNPAHWPTLKLLERALRAAGKQLVIGMRDRGNDFVEQERGVYKVATPTKDVRLLKGLARKPLRPVSAAKMNAAVRKSLGRK